MNKIISNTHPTLWRASQKEEYMPTKELKEHFDFYTYLCSIQKLIQKHTIDKAVLKEVLLKYCLTEEEIDNLPTPELRYWARSSAQYQIVKRILKELEE